MLDFVQVRGTAICLTGNSTVCAIKHLPYVIPSLFFVCILLHPDRTKQLGQSNSGKNQRVHRQNEGL